MPFKETLDVRSFTCGDEDLDDFLTTEEVRTYEAQGLGRTYLAYYEGKLVGYFTISNDGLRYEYLRKTRSFSRSTEKIVDSYPAIKIGRLAAAKEWQNKGIGRNLIVFIAKLAIESGARSGVRLLIVEAKPSSIRFYERCGFELTSETRRERGRRNRTMFLDLGGLTSLLPKD